MTLRIHPDEIVTRSNSPLLGIAPWWERVRLGAVAEVVNGSAFKSDLFNTAGRGMPLIRIRDVGQACTTVHYDGDFEDRYLVHSGDLLVGMDGDFRIARWAGTTALLNQRVCRLRILDESLFDVRFLEHCVQPYLDAVHAQTSSVTVKHLSSRTVADLPLPCPPRTEQERIVAALDEHLSRLDAAARSLHAGRSRLPLLIARASQAFLNLDAPTVAIREVAQVGSGATPARSNTRYWDGGTIPWITSGALSGARVTEPSAHITYAALRETAVRLWPRGTVLIAMYGEGRTRGRAAELMIEATCNQACAAIQVDPKRLLPGYLRWFLNSRYELNRRLASGGVQPNLSLQLVKAMELPLPSLEVQESVVAQLEEMAEGARRLDTALTTVQAKSERLRRTVLSAAFSGQLVPQDPRDEPASVLLERIRAERAASPSMKRTRKVVAS